MPPEVLPLHRVIYDTDAKKSAGATWRGIFGFGVHPSQANVFWKTLALGDKIFTMQLKKEELARRKCGGAARSFGNE